MHCCLNWRKKRGGREEMKRKSLGSGTEESVSCLWENLQGGWKQIPILDRPTCTLIFSCKRKTFLFNENKRNDSCCPFSLNSPSWERSLSSSLNLKCRLSQSTLAAGQNIFTNLDVIVICPQRHKKVLTEFRRKKKNHDPRSWTWKSKGRAWCPYMCLWSESCDLHCAGPSRECGVW